MAQKNIIIAGRNYNNTGKLTAPIQNSSVKAVYVETSDATAVAEDVANGKVVYVNGERVVGTGSGGGSATLIEKTVTANGTYNASADSADGYSKVVVAIPVYDGAVM